MLLQVRARGELFVAVLARVGLVAGVDSLVPDQVGYLDGGGGQATAWGRGATGHRTYLREGLVTVLVVASVRLFLVVDPSVLLERGVLGEGLVA